MSPNEQMLVLIIVIILGIGCIVAAFSLGGSGE